MYVAGEGSGEERKETRRREKELARAERAARRPQTAEEVGSKKHVIKNRKKAVGKFALQQVIDTTLAAGAALAVGAYMASIGAPHAISGLAVGIMAFTGKKVINAVYRFGKKHIIKSREKGNGKLSKGLILTAAGLLPILVTGIPIYGIVSLAIAATIMAKKAKKNDKNMNKKVSVKKRGKKNKQQQAAPQPVAPPDNVEEVVESDEVIEPNEVAEDGMGGRQR